MELAGGGTVLVEREPVMSVEHGVFVWVAEEDGAQYVACGGYARKLVPIDQVVDDAQTRGWTVERAARCWEVG